MAKLWSKSETDILREMYADTPTKDIAKLINRTVSQIYNQALKLGLKKTRAYLDKHVYTITTNESTQFRKGIPAWNKGMKGLQIGGTQTQFKKGQKPHNYKPDGSERVDVDGYRMIKVNGKYIPKHRYIYEQHHGKIPKGLIIVFKDKNNQNFDIDNLEAIDREENQRRNAIYNLPDEIKEVIYLKRTITKLITENGKRQNSRP